MELHWITTTHKICIQNCNNWQYQYFYIKSEYFFIVSLSVKRVLYELQGCDRITIAWFGRDPLTDFSLIQVKNINSFWCETLHEPDVIF